MATRRAFISAAALAATAGISQLGQTSAAAAKAKAPSAFAVAYATWIQKTMPSAHLSDALVQKIAGDIDMYAPTAAGFRKTRLRNWDEPDFTFVAGPVGAKR